MKIGIIGAGRVGSTLARHFVRIGHDVVISNSSGPKTLSGLVEEIGGTLRAVTVEQAATFGQVVVVCIPYGRYEELPKDALKDKVVIDTCNYYAQRDGHDPELDDDRTTSSEKIRAHTNANVVKAFNAIHWENLRDRGRPKGDPGRLAIPLSGTDTEAKGVVAGLIRDIGFDPVDAGDIGRGGRTHQPGGRLYGAELTAQEANDLLRAGAAT
jgi:predicted dinucleotide-binding enzyme